MASVFTFESEPIRLSSPWPTAPTLLAESNSRSFTLGVAGVRVPPAVALSELGIKKLEPEPQEGSTEYKLHLLLRPRRTFMSTSTIWKVPGSHLSKSRASGTSQDTDEPSTSTTALAPSYHSRQNRLQHLTTQLLWRLQQSSPHHSSTKSSLTLPILPEANEQPNVAISPGNLIPGLEESLGALYEIGISDDGTFVGLAPDEMEESLAVLRAMAFSLGCKLSILRLVIVGECQWEEEPVTKRQRSPLLRKMELLVAEVLVAPNARSHLVEPALIPTGGSSLNDAITVGSRQSGPDKPSNEQIRISLTGGTTSGKSSLLGTLSTSTFDNGRGKSRLSLLKHRHEIVSGVTSSLAQELIGYSDNAHWEDISARRIKVVNYASGNVSTWTDIHHTADAGRLVFVTDSAGHPRYRRTTVRGLVSWAPQWTLCCVAADDDEDSTGKIGATASSDEIFGSTGQGIDLSKAHLELCLKLDLPLVVIITKLDLASRVGLRQTLAKVLSILKSSGRKPAVISDSMVDDSEAHLQSIPRTEMEALYNTFHSVGQDELHLLVPIVLTSAVTGSGIRRVHALLRQLPILPLCSTNAHKLTVAPEAGLFHIDEVFTMTKTQMPQVEQRDRDTPRFILSGYLRYGTFKVGDTVFLGPFSADTGVETVSAPEVRRASSYPNLIKDSPIAQVSSSGPHRNFPSELDKATYGSVEHPKPKTSWQHVRIISLRNLRLPVHELYAGQVGTVAISTPDKPFLGANPCVRRGMVLRAYSDEDQWPAYSGFTAVFKEPNAYVIPGSSVTVYTASIRALAKILEVRIPEESSTTDQPSFSNESANDDNNESECPPQLERIEIIFRFTTAREWIETGTRVLVTPASGLSILSPPEQGDLGVAGLDGFAGMIVSALA